MVGYRKRHLFGALFFLFVLSMLFCPRMVAQAADGRLEIGLSSKEPQVGESLTVTLFAVDGSGGRASADMTLSYDTDVLSFESCDAEGSSGGDGTVTASGRVVTIQFTVIGEGKASLGLKGANGKSVSTQEALDSMAPAGTTVTAVASGGASSGGGSGSGDGNTSSGGDAGSGDGDASSGGTSSDGAGESGQDGGEDGPKSKDNSLSELSLSVGELSPTFSPSTIEYTAVVPYEVTKVEVTAKTSNPNAEIEAILGNQNLKVGENEITLTIRAENGGRVVYRIKVTRQEEEEDATQQGGEADGTQGDGTGTDTAPQDGDMAFDGTSTDGAGESGQDGGADGTQGDGTGTGTAPQDGDTASDGTSTDGTEESGQDGGADGTQGDGTGTDTAPQDGGTVSYEEQLALLDQEYGKLQSKYQEEKRLAQRTIVIMALVIVVLVFLLLNRTLFSRKGRTEEEEYWEEPRQKRSRKEKKPKRERDSEKEKKPKRERDPEKEKKPKHKRKDGQEKDTGQDGEIAGTDEVIDLDDL